MEVGDDSVDSNVDVESRRIAEEELERHAFLSVLGNLFGDWLTGPLVSDVDPSPKTDMKEGKVVFNGELVDIGILVSWLFASCGVSSAQFGLLLQAAATFVWIYPRDGRP